MIAFAAFVAVVAAIDPAGDYPDAPQGPGLTVDETFNVQQGVRLVEGLRVWLLGIVAGAKSSRSVRFSATKEICRTPNSVITTPTIRRSDVFGWVCGTIWPRRRRRPETIQIRMSRPARGSDRRPRLP